MTAMRVVCMDCAGGHLCPKHRAEEDARVQHSMAVAKSHLDAARALGVKWEEPPPKTPSRASLRIQLAPVFDLLRANPSKWAMIREYSTVGAAGSGKTILQKSSPPGRWEFRARASKDDGTSKLYGRYLGPDA